MWRAAALPWSTPLRAILSIVDSAALKASWAAALVAGGDELAHLLDGGAVLAALGGEMQVARNRLTGALASLLGVSHFFELS